MARTLLLLLFLSSCFSTFCQETVEETNSAQSTDSVYLHSPRKATLLSVVLPGAGQVYNKKYWKLPIVYGGLGVAIYYLDDNLKRVKLYRRSLVALQDDDPLTINETRFTPTQLDDLLDLRKRWRDISYVAIAGIYVLQIIDAHVDAQLFHFDVSDDLSLIALPYVGGAVSPEAGVSLTFRF